jgi:acylphosphatase
MTRRAARIVVKGAVQGVGFRYFCLRKARLASLVGWVRNRPDGTVEIWAEGDKDQLEQFVGEMRIRPSAARVESVDLLYGEPLGQFDTFEVTH